MKDQIRIPAAAIVHIDDWQLKLVGGRAIDRIVYGTIWDLTKRPGDGRPVSESELMAWAKVTRNPLRDSLDRLAAAGLIAHTDSPEGERGNRHTEYKWYCTEQDEMNSPAKTVIELHGWMLQIPELDSPGKLLTFAAIEWHCAHAKRQKWDGSVDTMCRYTGLADRQQRRILDLLAHGDSKRHIRSVLVRTETRYATKADNNTTGHPLLFVSYTTRDKVRIAAMGRYVRQASGVSPEGDLAEWQSKRKANNAAARAAARDVYFANKAANRKLDGEMMTKAIRNGGEFHD